MMSRLEFRNLAMEFVKAGGRERFAAARRAGTAVIEAGYLRGVERGFARLGAVELQACLPSLDPGGIPVAELMRHELP